MPLGQARKGILYITLASVEVNCLKPKCYRNTTAYQIDATNFKEEIAEWLIMY